MIVVDGKTYSGQWGLRHYIERYHPGLWSEIAFMNVDDRSLKVLNRETGLDIPRYAEVDKSSDLFLEALHKKLQATA